MTTIETAGQVAQADLLAAAEHVALAHVAVERAILRLGPGPARVKAIVARVKLEVAAKNLGARL